MSYFIVYAKNDTDPPIDGPHVASSMGYYDFGTHVEQMGGQYPELAHLVEEGWADNLDALAADLTGFAGAMRDSDADAAHVADLIAGGLRQKPEGTLAVLISDGEPGEDEPLEGDNYG